LKAEKMFNMTRKLVKMLGIDPERVRLEWVSSAEGMRFAEVVREFTEKIVSLGPAGIQKAA
jgi:F420-non-reducing hydrogenase iron-sulfur subunit